MKRQSGFPKTIRVHPKNFSVKLKRFSVFLKNHSCSFKQHSLDSNCSLEISKSIEAEKKIVAEHFLWHSSDSTSQYPPVNNYSVTGTYRLVPDS
ncbi:MAG: hypothetical protein GX267_11495 [Fibrobacter sp.]|nr:hypothetical protein [Fibrobacter sp.]